MPLVVSLSMVPRVDTTIGRPPPVLEQIVKGEIIEDALHDDHRFVISNVSGGLINAIKPTPGADIRVTCLLLDPVPPAIVRAPSHNSVDVAVLVVNGKGNPAGEIVGIGPEHSPHLFSEINVLLVKTAIVQQPEQACPVERTKCDVIGIETVNVPLQKGSSQVFFIFEWRGIADAEVLDNLIGHASLVKILAHLVKQRVRLVEQGMVKTGGVIQGI